jgi:hypothetical protein
MKKRMLLVAAGVSLAALAAACNEDYTALSPEPDSKTRFVIPLLGANERPNPVTTQMQGTAVVTIENPELIRYEVFVQNADSITAAHFHAGDANTAGPIMFGFHSTVVARINGGVLRQGDITRASTFSGIFRFDSLMTRIQNGTAYVNVHTRKNQPGEIRGQVVQ